MMRQKSLWLVKVSNSEYKKISNLVKNQFPRFYEQEGENFIAFVEAYYSYLEQNGKSTRELRNLHDYQNIAETTDEFINHFANTFLPQVPYEIVADKKLFIKYINQFNQSRGTLAAYKLLFRALYNEDVEIEFPSEKIMKVSDGDWRIDRYIVTPYNSALTGIIGKTITGDVSGAKALVEDVIRKTISGRDLLQIILSNIRGEFKHLENAQVDSLTFLVEAGISTLDIKTRGGGFSGGDIVNLVSNNSGQFGKATVVDIANLGDSLTYSIVSGGAGYTATSNTGTTVSFIGGDPDTAGSLAVSNNDIIDTYSIALDATRFSNNTRYGDRVPWTGTTFGDVPLNSLDYGLTSINSVDGIFYDQEGSVLRFSNTAPINTGTILNSPTANSIVKNVVSYAAGVISVEVDSLGSFVVGQTISNAQNSNLGTVSNYTPKAYGKHSLTIRYATNTAPPPNDRLNIGDVIATGSGETLANALVERVVARNVNGNSATVIISSNDDNPNPLFTFSPLRHFEDGAEVRKVDGDSARSISANVESFTANTELATVYSDLDSITNVLTSTFGTIAKLSRLNGGAGYTVAPTISIRENNIASLEIGEYDITLTLPAGIVPDSNDVLYQSAPHEIFGDIKRVISSSGTSHKVKVWTRIGQGNLEWSQSAVQLRKYNSEYVAGTADTRTSTASHSGTITNITSRGILGNNAVIESTVGSNGAIRTLKLIDSGFSYKDKEIVVIQPTVASNSHINASAELTLKGEADSEGYYSTTRSHLDSNRGFIQDNKYYQEFSYEVVSPISLDKYRDVVLDLCHAAGQELFGRLRRAGSVESPISIAESHLDLNQPGA